MLYYFELRRTDSNIVQIHNIPAEFDAILSIHKQHDAQDKTLERRPTSDQRAQKCEQELF